jgi:hypothetical protein
MRSPADAQWPSVFVTMTGQHCMSASAGSAAIAAGEIGLNRKDACSAAVAVEAVAHVARTAHARANVIIAPSSGGIESRVRTAYRRARSRGNGFPAARDGDAQQAREGNEAKKKKARSG